MSKALFETVVKSVHAKRLSSFCNLHVQQNKIIPKRRDYSLLTVRDGPLAEIISTLKGDQIIVAADKKTKGIEDESSVGIFLERVKTSCKATGYLHIDTRYNIKLVYAMCDMHGMPGVFFTLTSGDEYCFHVKLWANNGQQFDLEYLKCTHK